MEQPTRGMPDRKRKPGGPPLNKIGVYDHEDSLVGYVGHKATEATAVRFLKRRGATLQKRKGRLAWIGDKPNARA